MLITQTTIIVEGGKGGDGYSSFEQKAGKGPNGGDGGDGGAVYIIGTNDIYALAQFNSNNEFKAGDGHQGGPQKHNGAKGKDVLLRLPIGSLVHYQKSGYKYEVKDCKTEVKIAKGGRGGGGNYSLRNFKKSLPEYTERGTPGIRHEFFIELKLVADFGLIGLPNAGKSSLLNELTAQRVKVADYPFTTLEPNLGNINDKVIADIPGLIEGASEGKGLGTTFLKHIEKVGLILHCVPADSPDIIKEYEIVQKEIGKFSPRILRKPKIILLTKTDMVTTAQLQTQIDNLAPYGHQIIPISIHNWDQLEKLKQTLLQIKNEN